MIVRPVREKSDLKNFIHLPYSIYKNDPIWVPPLIDEQNSQFNPKRNPLLDHCKYQLFLLEEDRKILGRIAVFIDLLAIDFWKEPIGLFGYYECIDDKNASRILLETARQWLRTEGMKSMRGPWSFVSQEWGQVVEGFKPSPVIMAPYNPVYYIDHFTQFGLGKVKDLICFIISGSDGYQIPSRILTLTDEVARRYNVRIREIDMKHYDSEVQLITELSNLTIIDNWGFSPVTAAEVKAMARDMKPILQKKAVLFAEDANGRAIGFAITLPDINVILKDLNGRLLPFGWIKLLSGIPRLHQYRMFALGVIPEYQGKGIDSLIYRAMYEKLYTPDVHLEINYVLEDNYPMINAINKLDARPFRRYRVYEMNI
jgi:GNAT superfamily N-acetyltransferase